MKEIVHMRDIERGREREKCVCERERLCVEKRSVILATYLPCGTIKMAKGPFFAFDLAISTIVNV